jgi:hypothetical protein
VPILVVVGIGLVTFGAVVLLLFPDRPGGRIAWHDLEVSSVGAGLPLIALGVAAIAFGGVEAGGDDETSARSEVEEAATGPSGDGDCLSQRFLADIDPDRKATFPAGTKDEILIGPEEDIRPPIGLRLTDEGRSVGGVRLSYEPEGARFRVHAVVDADCQPISPEAYASIAGDPDGQESTWSRYDDVCVDFGPHAYVLQLGADPDIRFDFTRDDDCREVLG